MEQTNLPSMTAYLVHHFNGDIYLRDDETLYDDLQDILRHALDEFEETGVITPLFRTVVQQYPNEEHLDDHRPPSVTFRGVKAIADWAGSTSCPASRKASTAQFVSMRELSKRIDSKWGLWMTTTDIG